MRIIHSEISRKSLVNKHFNLQEASEIIQRVLNKLSYYINLKVHYINDPSVYQWEIVLQARVEN